MLHCQKNHCNGEDVHPREGDMVKCNHETFSNRDDDDYNSYSTPPVALMLPLPLKDLSNLFAADFLCG